jgi:hypothetical protein
MATYLIDFWERVYEVEEFNLPTIIELEALAFANAFVVDQRDAQMECPLVAVECMDSPWIPLDHHSRWSF